MKLNIGFPSLSRRANNKRRNMYSWHEKFAWAPTAVDETDTTFAIVWMERYMRKAIPHAAPSRPGKEPKTHYEKYSAANYFKKKLNGDFDNKRGGVEQDAAETTAYIGKRNQPMGQAFTTLTKVSEDKWTIKGDVK